MLILGIGVSLHGAAGAESNAFSDFASAGHDGVGKPMSDLHARAVATTNLGEI
jgi:hypothetical protein